MGSWMAMSVPVSLRHAEARHQFRRELIVFVKIAAVTGGNETHRIAGVASLEVLQAVGELGFEGLQTLDLMARRRELLAVDFAHLGHRSRSRWRRLPLAHDPLDGGERQAE